MYGVTPNSPVDGSTHYANINCFAKIKNNSGRVCGSTLCFWNNESQLGLENQINLSYQIPNDNINFAILVGKCRLVADSLA